MSAPEFDFVIYLGDPDEGAESLPSRDYLARASELDFEEAANPYGALSVIKDGENLVALRPDPILKLVIKLVRAVPYLIEGEPETALLTESEHGWMFEPSSKEVFVSCFAGDAYEPDEYLFEQTSWELGALGEQILSMGERVRDMLKEKAPDLFEDGEDGANLVEFLEIGREAHKTFLLEVERGLRVT